MTTASADSDISTTAKPQHQTNSQYTPSRLVLLLGTPTTILFYSLILIAFHTESSLGSPIIPFSNGNSSKHDHEYEEEMSVDSAMSLTQRLLSGPEYLTTVDLVLFGVLILLALELLNFLVKMSGNLTSSKAIPVRGKHLDDLSQLDLLFIGMNKAATPPFVYVLLRYMYFEPHGIWDIYKATFMNTIAPLPIIFLTYDFFYTILHWFLHVKGVYGHIHKHHHHQKAPSRANVDAVNVHPLEFFLGEYNHLLAVFLCCQVFRMDVHIICIVLFLFVGGGLAGLNHTRYDIVLSIFGISLFDSKNHDVHHRLPQSNYGQYLMFWDFVFGSYRPYNENDRINPKSQLDPATGKTIGHAKTAQLAEKRD